MNKSDHDACLRVLKETFHCTAFRPGQEEAATALLNGRDVLGVLPTGAGKSLCYQLPALVMEGTTLVVSPLIELMRDQVRHLEALHIPAVSLDSLMEREALQKAMETIRQGRARLVYASPERLQSPGFRGWWMEHPPAMVVVDEAHCVVRWGEAFRPSYGKIGDFVASLPARPVLCAMTATADRRLQRAIAVSLNMRHVKRVTLPLLRENLRYELVTTLHRDRCIEARVKENSQGKCVIFCRTRSRAEAVCGMLNARAAEQTDKAAFYHAGMPRKERQRVQEQFLSGEVRILAATSAFGMGIDVPDIRCVIHDSLPDSLADYAQQTGRAGRDGAEADCVLLLDPEELDIRRRNLRRLKNDHGLPAVKRWLRWRKAWRDTRQVLHWCLDGFCLPAGLIRAMGQTAAPCGTCSACRRAKRMGREAPLTSMPNLSAMQDWELRAWALRWERSELARKAGLPQREILPDRQLTQAAKSGFLSKDIMRDARSRRKMQDILDHLLGHSNNLQD